MFIRKAFTAGQRVIGADRYERILDRLDDLPELAILDEPGEVLANLKGWLEAFEEPLVHMTVDAAVSALQHRINGTDRGRLRELYRKMTPADMAALMQNNADAIRGFADQHAAEAAMIVAMQTKLTNVAAGLLMNALHAV